MALNLVRNSKLFFTTNVNATTGVVQDAGHTTATTAELQVLDGFSFSQNTNTETITVNEAGSAPTRGQRSFNTSLAPVDFSFSTYIRPAKPSTNVTAEEGLLWGALTSVTGNGFTEAAGSATVSLSNSNVNQLQKFGLIFVIDNVTYVIDNCVMNQVSVDFGIDAIATAAWSGNGGILRRLATSVTASAGSFSAGTLTGSYKQKITTSTNYIANKLSTANIVGGGTTYTVALTGGNLTYSNNVTFLTPANLGVVNTPIQYFTGTRSITGSVNAYLKTGSATDPGALLGVMLADTTNTSPNYALNVSVGGSSNGNRFDLTMPTCSITIPTVDVQQIVSTTINFTAQGSNAGTAASPFNIENANEMTAAYFYA